MLRFEKLELVGFKSFADKLEVAFNDRVTAVIGPNGCGKSNLFDAIGWALGSQSPRSLRGEKMEDVIFNGSGRRKPSGVAQVALTMRRAAGTPLEVGGRELEGETVEIRRKLYRSGESHYLINQKRCRLKDIQQVMEDLGLGYSSYALIPQGRIDSFLTGRPSDRRAVIEEAARILTYKSRRRSAEVKLEMAQQNLLRLNDIVAEVERRLRSLKRQAAKARRYKRLKEEFRRLQLEKFKLESEMLRESLQRCGGQLAEAARGREELESALAESREEYRLAALERDRLEEELNRISERRSELVLEADRTRNSLRHHREQIEATGKYLQANRAERKGIESALEKVREELESFGRQREELAREGGALACRFDEQTAGVAAQSAEVGAAEKRIEELNRQQLQLSTLEASLNNQKGQLETRLEDLGRRSQELETLLEEAKLALVSARAELQRRQKELKKQQAELDGLRDGLGEARESEAALERELAELAGERRESHDRLIALRERLQSLEEVRLDNSQYSEGVRKFLKHLRSSGTIQSRGTLADLLETESQYENLVEGFLDEELEFVLVDSMREAVEGLREVKGLKGGRCTFLTLTPNGFGQFEPASRPESARISAEPGVLGPLGSLIRMEPAVQDAFSRVLPQQAEAVVVTDLGRALDLAHTYPQTTFVTLEGETLSPRGLLAASARDSKKLGLLSLKRRTRRLQGKIEAESLRSQRLEAAREELAGRLDAQQEAVREQQARIHALDRSSLALQHRAEQAQAEVERTRGASLDLERRLESLRREQQESRARLEETIEKLRGHESEASGCEAALGQARDTLLQVRVEWDRMQQVLHDLSSSRQVLEERSGALERTLARVTDQEKGLVQRLEESEQSARRSQELIEQRKGELERLEQRRQELEGELAEATSALEEKQQEYGESRRSIPQLEQRLEELDGRRSEMQAALSRLEVEKARWETQLESIDQQCREQLQASLEDSVARVSPERPLEEVAAEHETLRQRLDTFGPINMTALEEYQENEERYTFLTAQRQDVETSIADTQRVIADLNRRSREQFREAFETVNRHFQEFFQRLFGGGECGMRLLDEDDLLESGIDIFAQPPGKRLQNVMLLSGGEKALTVLALLMGLFAYRPSKFCVLDEVDAPLDDANVMRFSNLVKEMSEQTQLILITHNKQTMQVADALYGVTMSEPGISEVVSVALA